MDKKNFIICLITAGSLCILSCIIGILPNASQTTDSNDVTKTDSINVTVSDKSSASSSSSVSCTEKKIDNKDNIDTIATDDGHFFMTPILDSIDTQKMMEDALYLNYISNRDPYDNNMVMEMYHRHDMEYLPYLFLTFSTSTVPPLDVERIGMHDYIVMCSARYDDKALFELGEKAVEKLNKRILERPGTVIALPNETTHYYKDEPIAYYDSFSPDNAKMYQKVSFTPSRIDTLRVKAIAHNDRKALRQLEKHYHEIGYDLGIAIYYKALLSRPGNSDLAERLYRVLKPYFRERPEFREAAYQALIQAAVRDKNSRAQQLCLALGLDTFPVSDR